MTRNNGAGHLSQQSTASLRATPASPSWPSGLVGGLLDAGSRLEREARRRVFPSWTGAARAMEWLEGVVGIRIAQALNALQIPTARDVQELNRRVEALHAAVIALERRAAAATPPAGRAVRRARTSTRKKAGG